MEVVCVAAMARNRVIGAGGQMPWRLPGDLKHFRELTLNHPVIMGRKTFESLGKPLDLRRNIVITNRGKQGLHWAIEVASSLEEALQMCREKHSKKAFIIGGGEIFGIALALDVVDNVVLTELHRDFDGDTFFPMLPRNRWELAMRRTAPFCKGDEAGYDFTIWKRIKIGR